MIFANYLRNLHYLTDSFCKKALNFSYKYHWLHHQKKLRCIYCQLYEEKLSMVSSSEFSYIIYLQLTWNYFFKLKFFAHFLHFYLVFLEYFVSLRYTYYLGNLQYLVETFWNKAENSGIKIDYIVINSLVSAHITETINYLRRNYLYFSLLTYHTLLM